MRAALVLFAPLALLTQGCGTVLQFAVGWDEEAKAKKNETRTVQITSAPPGATVTRRGGTTGDVTLGQTPLTDSHAVEIEETTESPQTWAIWAGCVVEAVAGLGIYVADQGSSSNTSDPFESDFTTSESSSTLATVGGMFILGALVDLVVGIVQESSAPSVTKRDVIAGKGEYQYIARSDGLPEASQRVTIPDMSSAHLVLDPKYVASAQPQQTQQTQPVVEEKKPAVTTTNGSNSKAIVAGDGWVIAVMNVEDSNKDQRDRALDPGLVRNLGDQMRVFIAQQGVRTIDRSSQDRALKDQISAVKSDSYKSCYDDSCQIELGKALAASHILRTRVARFGKRCVLNGELIDLKAEVTMAAASSQGDCGEEGFLNMGEEVARNLVRVQ